MDLMNSKDDTCSRCGEKVVGGVGSIDFGLLHLECWQALSRKMSHQIRKIEGTIQ